MKKDENDRKREGSLPRDPEEDAELMPIPPPSTAGDRQSGELLDPFGANWQTLSEAGVNFADYPPKRRWLLTHSGEGALPLGKCGVLASRGGVGKTQALIQLALAVALGDERCLWLDTFKVESPGNVLLALGEEDPEEIQRRLYRAACAMGLDRDQRERASKVIVALPLAGIPVALTARDERGNTATTQILESLQRHLRDRQWSLIILDPLSRFAGDDTEIDNAAATRFVQAVETLVKAPGSPTVLVSHHSGKSDDDGGPKVRGSSAIEDGFRWVATMNGVSRTKESGETVRGVRWTLRKTNYTRHIPDVYLVHSNDEHAAGALIPASKELAELLAGKKPTGSKKAARWAGATAGSSEESDDELESISRGR